MVFCRIGERSIACSEPSPLFGNACNIEDIDIGCEVEHTAKSEDEMIGKAMRMSCEVKSVIINDQLFVGVAVIMRVFRPSSLQYRAILLDAAVLLIIGSEILRHITHSEYAA